MTILDRTCLNKNSWMNLNLITSKVMASKYGKNTPKKALEVAHKGFPGIVVVGG